MNILQSLKHLYKKIQDCKFMSDKRFHVATNTKLFCHIKSQTLLRIDMSDYNLDKHRVLWDANVSQTKMQNKRQLCCIPWI